MEIQERKVLKRDGRVVPFSVVKIREAINKAVTGSGNEISHGRLLEISRRVGTKLSAADVDDPISVEVIQDMVELTLQEEGLYAIAKHYILYRDGRQRVREQYQSLSDRLSDKNIIGVVETALTSGPANGYDISKLSSKFETFYKPSLTPDEELDLLAKAAAELTSKEEPHWEYVAGNIVIYKIDERVKSNWADLNPMAAFGYPHRVKALVEYKLYGEYLLDAYTPEELNIAYHFITPARDRLFTYSGIDLIEKRYLTRGHDGRLLETPQEMFLGIALHLHMDEDRDKRMQYVKEHYDAMSQLKLTMATPTMSNARKPFHQLSSCFIETVEDSLDGIYRATTNFAEVSKHGGGMGMFFGHVRATGGSIRGFEGAAGGVIPWIKLANDTAVAVDQLGVRQGAVAVYLDVWHKDLPEFLQLRTNNGDDRKKAHDVFPAVSYPDYFWYLAEHDRGADWHMFDPKEVKDKMGFYLEDSFGKEWEDNYKACVAEPKLSRRTLKVKDVIRLIITSLVETGTPFTFNRDTANRMNPNKHAGNIYSSNLCVTGDTELLTEDGYKNMKGLYDSQEDFRVVVDERARMMDAKAEGVSIQGSTKVYKTMENAEIWKITTEDGQELKATPYHKMYVKRDGKIVKIPLHECRVGDDLLIPHVEGSYGKIEDESLAFILGIIASDGTSYRTVGEDGVIIYLYGNKQGLKEEIDMHLEAITNKYPEYFEADKYYQNTRMDFRWTEDRDGTRISMNSLPLGRLLADKGVDNKMTVPKFVKEGTRETQEAYLRGRWITDGTFIIGEQTSFELGSIDGDNLRDIQKIMSGMGIRTQLYYSDKRGDGFEYTTINGEHRTYDSKPIYSLRATSLLNTNKMYERNIIRDSAKEAFRERVAGTHTSFYRTKKDRYSKIASIVEKYSIEDVYDVRVDNGHSLIFNGIATGNCTEIFMNQSPSQRVQRTSEDGIVTEVIKSGDFPVCNLASLVLGNIDLDSPTELEHVVSVAIRALDNVITHNYYPTPFAKISNDKYRAIGLGASGYHHALAKRGIFYSSQAHLEYMDRVFEDINYYAIKASMNLANEKGKYPAFNGSDWDNGDYFTLREYTSDRWKKLSSEVHKNGLRNGWLLAVAPTGLI